MTDEELKQKEKEYTEVCKSKNALIDERKELLEDEKVKKYVAVDDKLTDVNKEWWKLFNEIIEARQENCLHPAWYFESGFTDSYEGRTYWTCKCVACGKRLIQTRSRDYPNDRVIWDECIMGEPTESKLSYEEVVDKWVKFMEVFPSEDKSIEEKGRMFTKMMNPSKK